MNYLTGQYGMSYHRVSYSQSVYTSTKLSTSDYYPFGSLMPGRTVMDTIVHCVDMTQIDRVWQPAYENGLPFNSLFSEMSPWGAASYLLSPDQLDLFIEDEQSGIKLLLDSGIGSGSLVLEGKVSNISDRGIVLRVQGVDAEGNGVVYHQEHLGQFDGKMEIPLDSAYSDYVVNIQGLLHWSILDNEIVNGHWVETEVLVRVCDEVGDKYRFGFNGQEKVNEISGLGNHNTAEFWEYDTRLGRRWNVDPVDQISVSNYAVFRNNPIILTDVDGDCPLCPDPTTSKEGDVFSPGEELMDYTLMDGLWTGVGGEFSTVDISASKIQELEFSSWAAKADWHINEFMSDNWIGRISGPESSWTGADGFKNKGWPTMKYTWGTLANIFTLNMFSIQTSTLLRTNGRLMNKKQIGDWTYEGVSLGVNIYNTYVPNNKYVNELGKGIDVYDIYKERNPFSLMNYGIRAIDYYQNTKENENSKEE